MERPASSVPIVDATVMGTQYRLSADLVLFDVPLTLTGDLGSDDPRLTATINDSFTVGDILEEFVGLIVPGFELRVPAPWDELLRFEFDHPELWMQGSRTGFTSAVTLNLADIVTITRIELWHDTETEAGSSVGVKLTGSLLGVDFEDVEWDPVSQPEPPIDTGGKPFELEYLGVGQHMELVAAEPKTVDQVVAALIDAKEDPAEHLRFSADAGWLLGLRFSALDTIDLDFVFLDPQLYGLMIHLQGEKAGLLAGLRFEIFYRKISDTLGVYHGSLELPEIARHLEVGVASVTLGTFVVDIYTDGSFLIDVGFPHDLDFTRSMAVEVFPFVGFGGFYFGILPAEATPGLPATTDGAEFGSVVAFGVGLEVGLGKTIEAGILSVGFTLTVTGILEGLIADYRPQRGAEPTATYYRVSGHVALAAHLYGSVNFGIVRADVDVFALASATVVAEAYRATIVKLVAEVSVELRVKILFITLNFGFRAEVRESFTIGADSTAPWELSSPPAGAGPLAGRRPPLPGRAGALFALEAHRVNPNPVSVKLRFAPQVTVAADDDGVLGVALVAMLLVGMPDPDRQPDPDSDFDSDSDSDFTSDFDSDFGKIFQACFRWAASIVAGDGGDATVLDREDLVVLQRQLGSLYGADGGRDVDDGGLPQLDVETVLSFWQTNFDWALDRWDSEADDSPATIFPMLSDHKLVIHGQGAPATIDFETMRPCSGDYRRYLDEYFDRLSMVIDRETGRRPARSLGSDNPSLPALIMVDYFRTVLRSAVADGLANFDSLALRTESTTTLGALVDEFGTGPVAAMMLVDEGSAEPAKSEEPEPADEGRHVARLSVPPGRLELSADEFPLQQAVERLTDDLGLGSDLSEAAIEANLVNEALLTVGLEITWPPIGEEPSTGLEPPYIISDGDTLELVAAALSNRSAAGTVTPAELVDRVPHLVAEGAIALLPEFELEPRAGQTIAAVAAAVGLSGDDVLAVNFDVAVRGVVRLIDCRQISVGRQLAAFDHDRAVLRAGAGAARFLLHGLRLPDPDHHDPSDPNPRLHPLYRLTGQQLLLTEAQWGQVADWEFRIGASNGNSTGNVTPDLTTVVQTAESYRRLIDATTNTIQDPDPEPDPDRDPETDALLAPYLLIGEAPPYQVEPRRLALATPVSWTRPPDGDGPRRHHLVSLPSSVRSLISGPVELDVLAGAGSAGEELIDAGDWSTATRIDVVIRQVVDPSQSTGYLPLVFEIASSDQPGRAALLAALAEEAGAGGRIEEVTIGFADPGGGLTTDRFEPGSVAIVQTDLSTFTRPPDADRVAVGDDATPGTLADPVGFLSLLWQAGVTNQGGYFLDYRSAGDSNIDTVFGRSGEGVISFLVLWADSDGDADRVFPVADSLVIAADDGESPGYSTRAGTWPASADGAEIPLSEACVAAGSHTAGGDIEPSDLAALNATTPNLVRPGQLVAVPSEPSDQDLTGNRQSSDRRYTVQPGDSLLSIALALDLTVERLADAAPGILLDGAVPLQLHPGWTSRTATTPPGSVALRALRRSVDHEAEDPRPIQTLADTFHLLGFEVAATDGFDGADGGPAMGPIGTAGVAPEVQDGPLSYRRVVPIARLATDTDDDNPYGGVGRTATIDFAPVDLYGNRSTGIRPFTLDIGFRDPLLGLDQWPGISSRYRPVGDGLRIDFRMDPGRLLVPDPQPHATLMERIRADRQTWRTIRHQLNSPGLRFALRWSLDRRQDHQLELGRLRDIVAAMERWSAAAAGLEKVTADGHRSLAAVAGLHRVSAGDVGLVNAATEMLLVDAEVILPAGAAEPGGTVRIITGDTLAGLAARHQVTVKDLISVNADRDILDPAVPVEIPLHHRLAPGIAQVHRIGADETLRSIAADRGISLEQLILANLTVQGWLRVPSGGTGRKIFRRGRHVTNLLPNDTLATILARALPSTPADESDPDDVDPVVDPDPGPEPESDAASMTAADLVRENDTGSGSDTGAGLPNTGLALVAGARLLLPPAIDPLEVPATPAIDELVVPLTVELELTRPAALVDRHFVDQPGVWRRSSEVTPDLSGPQGEQEFGRLVEESLPGWKLARESVPAAGDFHRDRYAVVRFDPASVTIDRAAGHYAVPPISTVPWTPDHNNGEESDPGPTTPLPPVDLDRCNERFLTMFERLLAPDLALTLRANNPRWSELLEIKQRLATAMTGTMAPVVPSPDRSPADDEAGRAAAVEVMEQRLLSRLTALYDPGSVIDHRVTLPPDWPARTRLYGRVTGEADVNGGEAKIGESAAITTVVTTGSTIGTSGSSDRGSVEAGLSFQPLGLEYDISSGLGDYKASRWVTFVKQPEPLFMGRSSIPLPKRQQPEPPLVDDDAVHRSEDQRHSAGSSEARVERMRRYVYRLDYNHLLDPGDEVVVELALNGNEPTPVAAAPSIDRLGGALQAIIEAHAPLGDPAVWSADTVDLDRFIELARGVADGWTEHGAAVGDRPLPVDADGSTGPLPGNGRGLRLHRGVSQRFTSRELDSMTAHTVSGRVTIVRNRSLVDGRSTDRRFVLRTSPVGLRRPHHPTWRHDPELDATGFVLPPDAGSGLAHRLAALFNALVGADRSPAPADRPGLTVQVSALIELRGVTVPVPITVPIGLWPRSPVDPDRVFLADGHYCSTMAERLWAPATAAPESSRWLLDIKIFSALEPITAPPLLHLARVVIPLSSVSRP